jgi:hypothetical protein
MKRHTRWICSCRESAEVFRARVRRSLSRLVVAQSHDRVNLHGAARGNVAGD